jgi:hypothetical protein
MKKTRLAYMNTNISEIGVIILEIFKEFSLFCKGSADHDSVVSQLFAIG